jgi:predicted DNA-binding transcriptional regulator YafY
MEPFDSSLDQEIQPYHQSNAGKNQLKLLKVYDILLKYSDENNQLSVKDIMNKLSAEGISTERKSIYQYIKLLESTGVDIITNRAKQNQYFIGNRQFELPELKLLVDAVLAAKFITEKKSQELIGKLVTANVSVYEAQKLQQQVLITKRPKTDNEKIYFSVNTIHQAITDKVQIRFKYYDISIIKEKVYRKSGAYYTSNPVCLIWDDDKYYMVAYHDKHKKFTTFRIDKMEQVSTTEFKAIPVPSTLNLQKHIEGIFDMYSGTQESVTLKVRNDLIGSVIDHYGRQIEVIPFDDKHFSVKLNVQISPTFFAWLFTFSDHITILSPRHVIDDYRQRLEINLKNHT